MEMEMMEVKGEGKSKELLRSEIQKSLNALTDQQNLDFISNKINNANPGEIRKMVNSLTETYNKEMPELMALKKEIEMVKGESEEGEEYEGEMTKGYKATLDDEKRIKQLSDEELKNEIMPKSSKMMA